MDNDKQQSVDTDRPAAVTQQSPMPTGPAQTQTAPQEQKPALTIPDSAALDLLAINDLQTASHSSGKFPTKLIAILVGLALLVAAASMAPGLLKSHQAPNSGGQTNGSAQHQSGSSDTSKQIDQEVQSCSNPVNAATSC